MVIINYLVQTYEPRSRHHSDPSIIPLHQPSSSLPPPPIPSHANSPLVEGRRCKLIMYHYFVCGIVLLVTQV